MALHPPPSARRRLEVTGVVQGVGFRPFVHRLATEEGLAGFVENAGDRVIVEVEGPREGVEGFARVLLRRLPPLARIDRLSDFAVPASGETGFRVTPSRGGAGIAIPPDAATCAECLRELLDPADRRHRHPFIACSHCGPRLTMVVRAPYDRANTTMAAFEMCDACRAEYEDPGDRRFHAEPIGCHDCGPRLSAPVHDAVAVLLDGGIVAVKGIGGYHLACDATSERAVARLRERKGRDAKPFAVMALGVETLAHVDRVELELLSSAAAPIVLLRRRQPARIADSVAPRSSWLGVMLPYTGLHHLLAREAGRPLVMTSGNRSDEPIAFEDEDARERLGDIADLVLSHDRPIARRCEDSVVLRDIVLRRSRGHAPLSLQLPVAAARPLIGVGAHLKSTFCLVRAGEARLSPHLGDLSGGAAIQAFRSDLALYTEMLGVRPEVIAHDLHPDYLSTRWAAEQDAELVAVQHHHAHAAACLAEHGESGPALAVVLDGTGYGTDGTIWGGELLRCDLRDFERLAHLAAMPMPGGEAAVREPWRMAAVHLERAGRPVPWEAWSLVRQSLAVNAPLSSGTGRLLDAVAALLGVREQVTYEGQAAIELEALAAEIPAEPYPCRGLDGSSLVLAAHDDLQAGRRRDEIAAAVHEGLAAAFAEACAEHGHTRTVVLSGGCLANVRLARSLRARLEAGGFRVLTHRAVPPGDGGISYGQAAVAAARM